MISMRRKYITRIGEHVRILCVDGPDPQAPIIGILKGRKGPAFWDVRGKIGGLQHSNEEHASDLVLLSKWKKMTKTKVTKSRNSQTFRSGEGL